MHSNGPGGHVSRHSWLEAEAKVTGCGPAGVYRQLSEDVLDFPHVLGCVERQPETCLLASYVSGCTKRT